ncbi:MAG: fumarylacetoacetate hydrolase family protein [Phycisphaeraceae bacterium]|nr:fumarylacetoacetate hydrolase family protein [Phycisphaeraceae bacterium]
MNLIRSEFGVSVELPGGKRLPIRHIIGVGMNYAKHAHEQGKGVPERPMLFTKNPMAACLNGDPIIVPKICQDRPQVDFETELGVVIGEMTRDISVADALKAVLGYCSANDVSARWWQKDGSGGQFCRGKSFDTFCPIGPSLVPASEVKDPQHLRLTTKVNGVLMQDANTSDMIFDVRRLIHEISRGTTLLPGTLILTGTPSGVGFARNPPVFLKAGDTVEVEVEGLGVLGNTVRFE